MLASMTVSRVRSKCILVSGRNVCCLHPRSLFLWTRAHVEAPYQTVKMGNARVESLLFVDDVARLSSSNVELQRALDRFAVECTIADMQISTKKTEVMVLSRQKKQFVVSVNGTLLKQVETFKYFEVEFSNDAKQDCEIERRIGSASVILRSLYRSVVAKKEVSWKVRMAIFNAVYRSTLIYGHEQRVMTERI